MLTNAFFILQRKVDSQLEEYKRKLAGKDISSRAPQPGRSSRAPQPAYQFTPAPTQEQVIYFSCLPDNILVVFTRVVSSYLTHLMTYLRVGYKTRKNNSLVI